MFTPFIQAAEATDSRIGRFLYRLLKLAIGYALLCAALAVFIGRLPISESLALVEWVAVMLAGLPLLAPVAVAVALLSLVRVGPAPVRPVSKVPDDAKFVLKGEGGMAMNGDITRDWQDQGGRKFGE